jgi:hypothetical protein
MEYYKEPDKTMVVCKCGKAGYRERLKSWNGEESAESPYDGPVLFVVHHDDGTDCILRYVLTRGGETNETKEG